MSTQNKHNWKFDGCSPHNGEYWYKCTICGQSDWIASYGTMDQLQTAKPCVEQLTQCEKTELDDWLDILQVRLESDLANAESGFSYNHALKLLTHFKEFRHGSTR